MTVKELIETLKTYDESHQVEIGYFDEYGDGLIYYTGMGDREIIIGESMTAKNTVLISASVIRNVLG